MYADYCFRSCYLSVSKHLIASHVRCYATQRFLRSVLGFRFGQGCTFGGGQSIAFNDDSLA